MTPISGNGLIEISTDEDIITYLSAKYPNSKFSSATRLTGGTVNAVWRIHVETLTRSSPSDSASDNGPFFAGEKPVIFKHAKPFVINNPVVPFAVERMDIEAQVMRLVPTLITLPVDPGHDTQSEENELRIAIPKVFAYDHAVHVLAISDGGDSTLKNAYALLSTTQVQSIGNRLGRWLAHLHARTASVHVGNRNARLMYRYAYTHVGSVWQKLGIGRDGLGKQVDDSIGALLLTDSECVCHGDFWPGNMLVRDAAAGQGEQDIPVTVVDWEMTRRGVGVTDVAQFTAEAYLLDRFRGVHHQLASTFLTSYIEQAKPDRTFWRRFAAHLGVHLSFWPSRVPWAGEPETRALAEFGASIVTMALDADDRLEEYVLNQLMGASAPRD